MRLIPVAIVCAIALTLVAPIAPASGAEQGVVLAANQTVPEPKTSAYLGAKWVRTFFSWRLAETSDDVYDQDIIDHLRTESQTYAKAGIKMLVVVFQTPAWAQTVSDPWSPPTNAAKYGEFMAHLAKEVPDVVAWEIWNEPDGNLFWRDGPRPEQYAPLLISAYDRVKAVAPQDTIVTGGMIAHDYDFLEALYANGAGGHFDAVGAHTDTACNTTDPDNAYRDERGRVGRWAFTGYREMRYILDGHGDRDVPIWLTEIGWNTASTDAGTCGSGDQAGKKPAGVSEATQAQYLTDAYRCLAADPYVQVAIWFSLQDVDASMTEAHRYGLIRSDGIEKPAYAAFKALEGGVSPRSCGAQPDHVDPSITLTEPADGMKFTDMIRVRASADDAAGGTGVSRIELRADGKLVRYFAGGTAALDPWYGSRDLPLGKHTITVLVQDGAMNSAQRTVTVEKVKDLAASVPTSARMRLGRVRRKRGRLYVTASGQLEATASPTPLTGRVYLELWKLSKVRKGKSKKSKLVFLRVHRYGASARKPFKINAKLYGPGKWRARIVYSGVAPYAATTTKWIHFTAR